MKTASVHTPSSTGRRLESVLAALLLSLAGTACETIEQSSLTANSAAYAEAHRFLRVYGTHRDEVRARYGEPDRVRPDPDGGQFWI